MRAFFKGVMATFVMLVLFGCVGGRDVSNPGDVSVLSLVAKCAFTNGNGKHIEPGEAFVYAFVSASDGRHIVVSRIAEVREPLRERGTVQKTEPQHPARLVGAEKLEWGDLDSSPEGRARNFIAFGGAPTGEIATSIGTTELTDRAYPLCVYWGP